MKVCVGGLRYTTGAITTREVEGSDGSAGWTADHGATVHGIAAHPKALTVATGGVQTSSVTTRYYDGAGAQQWTADHGATVYAVAVDSAGNVYTGGIRTSSLTTRKYNSSGTLQWSVDHGADVYGIAVDADGNVYACGSASGGYTVRRYDAAGGVDWSANSGNTQDRCIALDGSHGYVYVGGHVSGSANAAKFALSDGTKITDEGWPIPYGYGLPRGMAVDLAGNVYIAGLRAGGASLWAYNATGTTLLWYVDHGTDCYAVAVRPDVITTPPGLAVPLALEPPALQTSFHPLPALAMPLALGVPSSPVLLPPLGAAWRVYRGWLTVGSELLPLSIGSIQGRRRRNDSTWVVVTVPAPSAGLLAALEAAIDTGWLVIEAGTAHADSPAEYGELLRAVVTETALEWTPGGRVVTVTGRVAAPPEAPTAWTLQGVIKTMRDGNQRGARCTVIHPRARPGDTVTVGAETFEVYRLEYRITPGEAWLEVWEEN